jgi:hypothetical protein
LRGGAAEVAADAELHPVKMVAQWNRLMQPRSRPILVALEYRYGFEVSGEHAGGHQSRQTATDIRLRDNSK